MEEVDGGGGSLNPITGLISELPVMILQGFTAELARNIWLLVSTECLQSWSVKAGRRIKRHQLPSGPLPTALRFLGMAALCFSSYFKPTKCC